MAQTDRQTDKATIWAVTAFKDEIDLIKDQSKFPAYVRNVVGQDEICPETGTPHFQGFIQLSTQQRLSALKKWLPTAHFEICRDKHALLRYVKKEDTRDPCGNSVDLGPRVEYIPFDRMCEILAETWLKLESELKAIFSSALVVERESLADDMWLCSGDDDQWMRKEFKYIINYLILNGYSRQASAFADNRLKNFWIDTGRSWIQLLRCREP